MCVWFLCVCLFLWVLCFLFLCCVVWFIFERRFRVFWRGLASSSRSVLVFLLVVLVV